MADYLADYLAIFHDDLAPFNIEFYTKSKDIGFEPIQWKYECQGLHLSKMGCKSIKYQAIKWLHLAKYSVQMGEWW